MSVSAPTDMFLMKKNARFCLYVTVPFWLNTMSYFFLVSLKSIQYFFLVFLKSISQEARFVVVVVVLGGGLDFYRPVNFRGLHKEWPSLIRGPGHRGYWHFNDDVDVGLHVLGCRVDMTSYCLTGRFYTALFSALVQTHWAHVAYGSEWVTASFFFFVAVLLLFVFSISAEVVYWQAIWLLRGWCHVELLPSRRKFCVHHTTMHQFTASLHSKLHRKLTLEKKFSRRYCGDWNPGHFDHESGALTTELPWLPLLLSLFRRLGLKITCSLCVELHARITIACSNLHHDITDSITEISWVEVQLPGNAALECRPTVGGMYRCGETAAHATFSPNIELVGSWTLKSRQ